MIRRRIAVLVPHTMQTTQATNRDLPDHLIDCHITQTTIWYTPFCFPQEMPVNIILRDMLQAEQKLSTTTKVGKCPRLVATPSS